MFYFEQRKVSRSSWFIDFLLQRDETKMNLMVFALFLFFAHYFAYITQRSNEIENRIAKNKHEKTNNQKSKIKIKSEKKQTNKQTKDTQRVDRNE